MIMTAALIGISIKRSERLMGTTWQPTKGRHDGLVSSLYLVLIGNAEVTHGVRNVVRNNAHAGATTLIADRRVPVEDIVKAERKRKSVVRNRRIIGNP